MHRSAAHLCRFHHALPPLRETADFPEWRAADFPEPSTPTKPTRASILPTRWRPLNEPANPKGEALTGVLWGGVLTPSTSIGAIVLHGRRPQTIRCPSGPPLARATPAPMALRPDTRDAVRRDQLREQQPEPGRDIVAGGWRYPCVLDERSLRRARGMPEAVCERPRLLARRGVHSDHWLLQRHGLRG